MRVIIPYPAGGATDLTARAFVSVAEEYNPADFVPIGQLVSLPPPPIPSGCSTSPPI